MKFSYLLAFLIIVLSFEDVINQDCNENKCGLCLRNPGCVWCKDPSKLTLDKPNYSRCGIPESHGGICNDIVTLEPPTSRSQPNEENNIIQPKSHSLKLGVGQSKTIEMIYTDPGNKPLDLYYLMDLSNTMKDDKEAVIKLGKELAGALKSTTTDLRMGFGSFIDKPMLPYATLSQINMLETKDLTKPYGFRNHLKLSTNHGDFEKAVSAAKISLNLDAPEGGLDAIMQAIVCRDEIGWRDDARRILVLSTDGNFHIAGDGKLGGIVTPNDGKCHMENNQYTHSTILDYPSISQIISKVQQERIFIIFAIVESEKGLYEELANHLRPYASTIILNDKSTNVDALVRDQYERIRSTVELLLSNGIQADNTKPFTFVELDYKVKCTPSSQFISGHKCEGVISNAQLRFMIDVKLLRCPDKEEQWKTHFDISTSVGSNEKLRVNLDLNCKCDCETDVKRGSRECTNQGEIRCGICSCLSGYLGDSCECLKNVTTGSNDDDSKCKKSSLTTCSGKGICNCGLCQCEPDYRGEFCECNQRKCPIRNGVVCSGNGMCNCEECKCSPGYKGNDCGCPDSESNCKREGDDKLCNGEGECKCNKCECIKGRSGKFCQVCLSTTFCQCLKEVEDYVRCSVRQFNSTHVEKLNDTNHCLDTTVPSNVIDVDYLDLRKSIDPKNGVEKGCAIPFETRLRKDCHLHYMYSYKDGIGSEKLIIAVKSGLSCPIIGGGTSPLKIILGTISTILIIGILTLLLWKIITYFHDKKEYMRFEQERKVAKWGQSDNPLYKESTTTFKNPAYTE